MFFLSHSALIALLALVRTRKSHSQLFGLFSDERNAIRIIALIVRETDLSEITEESVNYLTFFSFIYYWGHRTVNTFTVCVVDKSDTHNYIWKGICNLNWEKSPYLCMSKLIFPTVRLLLLLLQIVNPFLLLCVNHLTFPLCFVTVWLNQSWN